VGIYVKFCDEFSIGEDWNHNFRFHLGTAGEIIALPGDILDHDGVQFHRRLTADSFAVGDFSVFGGRTNKGSQNQLLFFRNRYVKSNPVVVIKICRKKLAYVQKFFLGRRVGFQNFFNLCQRFLINLFHFPF